MSGIEKPAAAEPRATRRKRVRGVVTSARMEKTIVVSVSRHVLHPEVEKVIRRVTAFKAHDERREARAGDEVEIEETRPLSRTKRWRLVRILRSAGGDGTELAPGALSVEAESQARRAERERSRAEREKTQASPNASGEESRP